MRVGVLRTATPVLTATLVLAAALAGAGCDQHSGAESWAPADVVLSGEDFPKDFTHQQVTVESIRDANFPAIEQAAASTYTPPQCRPTADAYVNPRLTSDNSAVVGRARTEGQQMTSVNDTIVELVTTVRRDIAADRAATSGPCKQVRTVIGGDQIQSGGTITSHFVPLEARGIAAGVDYVLYRQEVLTQVPNNPDASSRTLAGYAVVTGPGNDNRVTLQLVANVSVPTQKSLSDDDFAKLFVAAVDRARSVLAGG